MTFKNTKEIDKGLSANITTKLTIFSETAKFLLKRNLQKRGGRIKKICLILHLSYYKDYKTFKYA